MKFLIVSFALAAVASAQYQNGYKDEQHAAIVSQASEVNADGSYAYQYQTDNGISGGENGALKAVGPNGEPAQEVEGGYSYTAPDGQPISVRYVAGPQGFIAEGAHLPTSPPIPEAILRALAYNAAHPEKEETQYYKPEPQKPNYYTPIPTTPRPIYQGQYTTPKPYYTSVRPTYQPTPVYPTGFPQAAFGYTPQAYFNPAGRR